MDDWRSYDDVAATYERIHAPRMAEPAADLIAAAGVTPGNRVLDVGTGTGVAAQAAIEAAGPDGLVVGIDVSGGMLDVGRRVRGGVRFAAASAIDLPFADATFDAVVANFVLSHFTRYETALYDILRVLRVGGRLAVSSWGPGEDELDRTWWELVQGVVQVEMLADIRKKTAPWWDRFADRTLLQETLFEAGLRRIGVEKHRYRFRYSIEEYIAGRAAWGPGRFVRQMLGPEAFERFLARTHDVFAERFPDPLTDLREVLIAAGTKT